MPNVKPIVSSFHEIANTPDVSLTVDRGYAIDNILQVQFYILNNKYILMLMKITRLPSRNIWNHLSTCYGKIPIYAATLRPIVWKLSTVVVLSIAR